MTDQFKELLEKFNEQKEELEKSESLHDSLMDRLRKARALKSQIEIEKAELREKRPSLLADGENVTSLNKRLKEIDEEIELKEDEISGLKTKIPELKDNLVYMCQNTNAAYSSLVCHKIPDIYPEYNKQAEKLAEIVKEYHVIKGMSHDNYKTSAWTHSYEKFEGALGLIPSLSKNGTPFFDKNNADYSGIGDKLRKRYGIPDYNYRNHDKYKNHEIL